MKRERDLIVIFLLIALSVNFVSASPINQDIERFINEMGETFLSIFAPLLGVHSSADLLFARISFFFLTFIVVYLALGNVDLFDSNKTARTVITSVVAILSARYVLEVEIIHAMILPYRGFFTGLGVTILPLMLLIIVHKVVSTGIVRRIILFTVGILPYGFYWFGARYVQDQNVDGFIASIPLIILALGFLLDGWIQDQIKANSYKKAGEEIRQRAIQSWLRELDIAQKNNSKERIRVVKKELKNRFGINV